jgi:hypothetical protein
MLTFSLECFQNKHLNPGTTQVDALVIVTSIAGPAGSTRRELGSLSLRLWTPHGATTAFVRQVFPWIVELSGRESTGRVGTTTDYPTGMWGAESRNYQIRIGVTPGHVGEEMLAGRVTLMIDGEPAGQALIRALWTQDGV